MDEMILKNIIASLNKPAFSRFVYNLWYLKKSNIEIESVKTQYLPKIGNNIFEHHKIKYTTQDKILINKQIYTLVIPFFYPIELFHNIENIKIVDTVLLQYLKKYKRITDKRHSSWLWTVDGNYYIPNIAFVSNYLGLNEDIYQDKIIPAFQELINEIEFDAQAAVGTIDSFFELEKEATQQAFYQFINNYQFDIAISFNNDISVNKFISGKYLSNGVLKNSLNPCEPIFQIKRKNDIIAEFEYLIRMNSSEAKLEMFLKKYYQYILGNNYDRIETQLWLKFPELDICNKNRRLDIFLRNAINQDWELVELKKANIKLTKTERDIPVFVNAVHNSIQQIQNYKRILSQDNVKRRLALDGIEYYEPEYRLVIGRNPDISLTQWRNLKISNENGLKISTYDELLKEANKRYDLLNDNIFEN